MKLTLLEMVQLILSSMDSDEVNSISDTTESLQVANIIKESYLDLVSRMNLPEMYSLFELDPSDDPTKPTLMYIPDDIESVLWIKYNNATTEDTSINFQPVRPMDLQDFMEYTYNFDTGASEFESFTHTINGDTIDFFCYTNIHPRYYTVVEDNIIVFDSYDSSVDTTLQKSKTVAYGMKIPTFSLTDSFTPSLDSAQFNLLLNEAKSQAHLDLKQAQNLKAEQRAKRAWIKSQVSKEAIPTSTSFQRRPNYGRY